MQDAADLAHFSPAEVRDRAIARQKLHDAATAQTRSARAAAEKIRAAKRVASLRIVPVDGAKSTGAGAKKPTKGKKTKSKAGGAQECADETPAAEEAQSAPPASPEPPTPRAVEAAEVAEAAMRRAEEEREAERERVWAEREQQRREVMAAIVEEERRLRRLAQQRRERLAAEKQLQKDLHDAAYEGDIARVREIIQQWCAECFADLIGAKIDCIDHEGNSALSEAACGGHADICRLLLKHGANVNLRSHQGRTPLWRAAFVNHCDAIRVLLEHGADPRIASCNLDLPESVAPSDMAKTLLMEWPEEETDRLIAARAELLAGQWAPPERDEDDEPCGEPGYSLNITLTRLADALDAVGRDTDRYSLVVDLGGKANTYFSYRDCNMALAYKPSDADPCVLRKLLLGALRYGKPFVLDMLSMPLEQETICELLDPVLPGLLGLLISRKIVQEVHYAKLVRDGDEEEYTDLSLYSDRALAHFHFILLSRVPVPPQWCVDGLFVIKVASALDDDLANYR